MSRTGFGSSLTIDGTVECDSMVATSDGFYGAVGGLKDVRNPVEVADLIRRKQKIKSADGRVPPWYGMPTILFTYILDAKMFYIIIIKL